MPLSAKATRKQLLIAKPFIGNLSLKTIRKGQNVIGSLMESHHKEQVIIKRHSFARFTGGWVLPRDLRREGVILYLHGGGYACGGIEYATGFGSMLSVRTGTRVFCAAYRLAPEDPFPAAVEDAAEAYGYLLRKGYTPDRIALCGESAGGGLCYALCLHLQQQGLPLPGCVVTISPWVNLENSGESYDTNRDIDPSMTRELLEFYADCYTARRRDPLASPLLSDLAGMPPSLIFAGSEEILLSDSVSLHEKLLAAHCHSQLHIAPERWHGYLLYGLQEDARDFDLIGKFLNQFLTREQKLRWLPLDNAAKIYPAARRNNWSNMFRLSASLTEPVDKAVLQTALDVTVRRFPSIAVRLRRGMFWYYLQELETVPPIREESSYPLTRMSRQETRSCAFRVLVHENRIAVEFFHSLTDGTGGLIFLKSLLAEYLQQKYGIHIPAEHGVLGRLEMPSEAELEDSFPKYAGAISASRKETTAWRYTGTPETAGFLNVTCFELDSSKVVELAHAHKVTVTTFLCAVTMQALQNLQAQKVPDIRRRKAIRVLIPVNLRNLFESRSLRNFALYSIPEILPRLGTYSFEEICHAIRTRMAMDNTQKHMSMMIATNVGSEKLMAVRLMPLFLKNIVMKAVFDTVGERKSCLCLSNLGAVKLPEEMKPYIQRMDFILGTQATAPYNCGIVSHDGTLYINFIRSTTEPDLEYHFHKVLQDFGLTALVRSNQREKEE